MSEFSEKCKYYLLESGGNVYQLSQTFKLDRTTLQRMTTGKRLPSIDFIIKFCKCVRMDALQTTELLELYKIDKLGKTVYNNRKCILRILEYLHVWEAEPFINRIDFGMTAEEQVYQHLQLCFDSPKSEAIYTNLPPGCISFFRILHRLFEKYNKVIPVTHLFPMQSNPSTAENVNANLEMLYALLPIAPTVYANYQFYYYYSRIFSSDLNMTLHPYYVITSTSVTLLSANLTSSVLLSDAGQVCSYRTQFEQAIKLCRPLIARTIHSSEVCHHHARLYEKAEIAWYILEHQPCIYALCYSKELVEASSLTALYESYLAWNKPFYNFFTIEGLDGFVRTGQVCGHYEQHPLYFTPSQRIQALRHFLYGNPDFYRPCLLKEGFPCNESLHLEVYSNLDMRFNYIDQHNIFYSLVLEENSIGHAFKDFFQSLPGSDMLYPQEEMVHIVKERITWLQKNSS